MTHEVTEPTPYPIAAERARIREILTSPAAGLHFQEAAHLALNTSIPAKEAIEILSRREANATGNLFLQAMALVENPSVGADPGEDDAPGPHPLGLSAEEQRLVQRILSA